MDAIDAEKRSRSLFAGWALRSLEKDGPGTVGDLVDRYGNVGYYEMEQALQSLVLERFVRSVKKSYGFLYVVDRRLRALTKRGKTSARERALGMLRSAGPRGIFQSDLATELGTTPTSCSDALAMLEKAGLARRTYYIGGGAVRNVWTAAEYTPVRGSSTPEEAKRVREGDPLMEALSSWASYAELAEILNTTPIEVAHKMRAFRRNGCVESRKFFCKGRMRKQWRAIAASK